jgi:hypothetical protein
MRQLAKVAHNRFRATDTFSELIALAIPAFSLSPLNSFSPLTDNK